ncbi:hypothetical protein CHS0354_017767 [Potamilus streckersoni]|uniref:Kinesin-like protein n=1 Tax=Potamilus streckersoni TaxID=2493646 RepID=A0AAE0W8D0_9BIVA|nr:hypothetical protein CHS0354_017767 [Potamilus streckersoni]
MASLSPFVNAKNKSKRVLPSVPAEKSESKGSQTKSVTFNAETIETSIGGSQSLGKLKTGVPLSPVNQSRNDDINFRDEESERGSQLNKEGGMNMTMLDESANKNVDFIMKCKDQCSEDKENIPNVSNVQGISQIYSSTSKHQDLAFVHFDPACDMKMHTPIRRHTIDSEKGTPECFNIVHMDKFRDEMTYLDMGSQEDEEGSNSSVTVAVRVRPFSQRELADKTVRRVVSMCGNETTVTCDNGAVHRFAYDFSFWSFDSENGDFAGQELVHGRLAQPLLSRAFEGYNTCLFAYGQTGSGKSYSIMGQTNEVGIIPRFCEDLFFRAQAVRDINQVKISVEISFFEIYNEKIHDLLGSSKEKSGKKPTLKVREHPVLGPYVEGLSTFVVNSFEDVEGWITLGNKNRATAATGMNDKSSRSHSVFTIVLAQTKTEMWEGHEHDHSITSKINLVDLAGSERQSQAMTSGERLREGANINKSLLTLGKVISLLSEQSAQNGKKKKTYIPYRDSVLTWLLKESLGGNSKTTMIATISPANSHIEETLSTLRYPF